ncbi:MAG: soluble lytic murein transglycosylase [Cellvibrionaceae bacterium]|jgi:soluble lytic murein transglycosylase
MNQLLIWLILSSTFFSLTDSTWSASPDAERFAQQKTAQQKLSHQRKIFAEARQAFSDNDHQRYQKLREQLAHYPLLPYLEYRELRQRLDSLPHSEVTRFLERYQDSYLAQLLLGSWLDKLAHKKLWHEYRRYYRPKFSDARYRCWSVWSKFKTGDRSALAEVEPLWNVSVSQPHHCDPLFKKWREAGYLTVDLVWERHRKALLNRQYQLARYLRRYMPKTVKEHALLFQQVLSNPDQLRYVKKYKKPYPYFQEIIFHGLLYHAKIKPEQSLSLWHRYKSYYPFSEAQFESLRYRVARTLADDGREDVMAGLLENLSDHHKTVVVEILLRKLLREQDWPAVLTWIARLPLIEQQSNRWRYWRARTHQALGNKDQNYRITFAELASTRSYYGFLSADWLNQDYHLQHVSVDVDSRLVEKLKKNQAFARARELFHLDKLHFARQEWRFVIKGMNAAEHQAAAKLANRWGWYRKSIESMAAAEAWDDLNVRFPFAHNEIVQRQARDTQLPATLIFAIARQESAWGSDARSRAGAMGLMQLLPSTAKYTAEKAGLDHRRSDLLKPEHNIKLGSHYMSQLLEQYNNNRVPAIAAYNAGPNRVNRWLQETDKRLPNDVWIESIPFSETRKYVKNVLSYAVIYGYRMKKSTTLLTLKEGKSLL